MFLLLLFVNIDLYGANDLLEDYNETEEEMQTISTTQENKQLSQQLKDIINIVCKEQEDENINKLCDYLKLIPDIAAGTDNNKAILIITIVVLVVVFVIIIIMIIVNKKVSKVDENMEQQRQLLDRLYVYDENEEFEDIENMEQQQEINEAKITKDNKTTKTTAKDTKTKEIKEEQKDPKEHEFRLV